MSDDSPDTGSPPEQQDERKITNPALRLHTFFKECKGNGVNNVATAQIFLKTARIAPPKNTIWAGQPGLTHIYASLDRTFLSIVRTVQEISPDRASDLLNSWAGSIQQVIKLEHAGQPWQSQDSRIADSVLMGLMFTGIHLETSKVAETVLQDQELQELVSEAVSLAEALATSSLPTLLRDTLLRQVLQIRWALEQYRFFGNDDLEEAFAAAVGTAFTNVKDPQDAQGAPATEQTIGRYTTLLANVARVLATVSSIGQLPASIQGALDVAGKLLLGGLQ